MQLMVVVPFIIPVFLPLGFGFFWVRGRYLATSREVKRWEATSRSPVFASFSAILKVSRLGAWSGVCAWRLAAVLAHSRQRAWGRRTLWTSPAIPVMSSPTL